MKLYITLESRTEKDDRFMLKKEKGDVKINIANFFSGCAMVIKDAFYDKLQHKKWRDEYPATAHARLCRALDVVNEVMTFICPDNDKIELTVSLNDPLDKYEKEAREEAHAEE